MTDVARLAGVSQSSVSLVLNGMTGARLSDSTRERVMLAARRLGYQLPSRASEAPAGRTIAFIIDEISTSPHPVVNLDGLRDEAWESGLLVSTHVTRSNAELEAATLDAIRRDETVLGVIYATIFTRKVIAPFRDGDKPFVLLNCFSSDKRHASIVPAERDGGAAAARHLLEHGHRHIGFINGEPWMRASADRLHGFRRALQAHGVAFDENLVRNGDWLPLTGYQLALELLRARPRPTALFCANDLMALGALEAAAELGLDVPGALSIMGYDDQELARYTHPPLSTLVLPNYEMGRKAAATLIAIARANLAPRAIKVAGPVVERGSVGRCPDEAPAAPRAAARIEPASASPRA